MRAALLLPLAILAGCIDPSVAGNEPAFEPLHIEGEYWVPLTPSTDPSTEEIRFPVNATGRTVRAEVSITETYGGTQITGSTAEMTIRLYDPNGDEVGTDSRIALGAQNLHVETRDLPAGEAMLRIEVRGGSDGSGNGDHVSWTIDVR